MGVLMVRRGFLYSKTTFSFNGRIRLSTGCKHFLFNSGSKYWHNRVFNIIFFHYSYRFFTLKSSEVICITLNITNVALRVVPLFYAFLHWSQMFMWKYSGFCVENEAHTPDFSHIFGNFRIHLNFKRNSCADEQFVAAWYAFLLRGLKAYHQVAGTRINILVLQIW